jgi:hypothetical protein
LELLNDKEVVPMNIEGIKMKYEENLLRLPNVIGLGIGEKGGTPVIKVFVTHKVPESSLQPHDIIPKLIEGYGTEVEEIGTVTAQSNQS